MKKKVLSVLGVVLTGALLIGGCGGGSVGKSFYSNSDTAATAAYSPSEYYDDYDYNYDYEMSEEAVADFGTSSGSVTGASAETVSDSASVSDKKKVDNNRKLIKTVDIDVETKEFDALISAIDTKVYELDGYVESQNTWNGTRYDYYGNYKAADSRNASYTIRIPRENLDAFLESISSLCNVKSKNENVQDITLAYVDLESHKKALETEEERLLELMKQATEMYDILTIEDKLTDIRYQLQSMESQLRTYDNKVTYSTITMDISEVKELTYTEPDPETFWDRLSSKFTRSIRNLGEGIQDFIIWFIAALPHLLIWGGIIFGIAMAIRAIVRFNIRKARKRREEEALKKAAQPSVYAQNIAPAQTNAAPAPAQPNAAPAPAEAPAQDKK